MDIYEFADIIQKDIEITRFANQGNRFIASFKQSYTKGTGTLEGTYGDAKSAIGAIQDYTAKIRGKVLVFEPINEKSRPEFAVPKDIKSPLRD